MADPCSVCGRPNTWHPDCPVCTAEQLEKSRRTAEAAEIGDAAIAERQLIMGRGRRPPEGWNYAIVSIGKRKSALIISAIKRRSQV